MLYEAIRLGCEIYHRDDNGTSYNRAYDALLRNLVESKWTEENIDIYEVSKVRSFINQEFRGRMQASNSDILSSLQKTLPHLSLLQEKTIFSVDFDEILADDRSIGRHIEVCFDIIAKAGPRYESTGASKILHAVNPDLFIMWDRAIRGGYGLMEDNWKREGKGYAYYFLPRMQSLAEYAIGQVVERKECHFDDAIRLMRSDGCSHTLAKILDEYNYTKFTLNDISVWEKEYGS